MQLPEWPEVAVQTYRATKGPHAGQLLVQAGTLKGGKQKCIEIVHLAEKDIEWTEKTARKMLVDGVNAMEKLTPDQLAVARIFADVLRENPDLMHRIEAMPIRQFPEWPEVDVTVYRETTGRDAGRLIAQATTLKNGAQKGLEVANLVEKDIEWTKKTARKWLLEAIESQ